MLVRFDIFMPAFHMGNHLQERSSMGKLWQISQRHLLLRLLKWLKDMFVLMSKFNTCYKAGDTKLCATQSHGVFLRNEGPPTPDDYETPQSSKTTSTNHSWYYIHEKWLMWVSLMKEDFLEKVTGKPSCEWRGEGWTCHEKEVTWAWEMEWEWCLKVVWA